LAWGCAAGAGENTIGPWRRDILYEPPRTFSAEQYAEFHVPGVRALLYESVPYKGRPVKVFAYYGTPAGDRPPGGWPAVVLAHGGGGTAYASYVKTWNSWGYAAIAMDRYGKLPKLYVTGPDGKKQRVLKQDRPGVDGGHPILSNASSDQTETWNYHSVCQIVLAHSLIRSYDEVDADRIGLVGASWGGIHASLAAAVDDRFKFVIPVYSSVGFFRKQAQWSELDKFVPLIRVPSLWTKGPRDQNFFNKQWQYTIDCCGGRPVSQFVVPLGHSDVGQVYPINRRFADSVLKGGDPLPVVARTERRGNVVSASVESVRPILKAELAYTLERPVKWQSPWQTKPAVVKGKTISAELPDGVVAFVLNVFDEEAQKPHPAFCTSSNYIELDANVERAPAE
jgi:dienelactone hydrolase